MTKTLMEVMGMVPPPRERGRPSLPKDEQKVKINITLDRDVLEWIDQHGTNRSRFINKMLRLAATTDDNAAPPQKGHTKMDIQSVLIAHGLELIDRDRDGLLRVRYTEENPNRGFFRQFDTMAEVETWLSTYGRDGTWEPEWDLEDA